MPTSAIRLFFAGLGPLYSRHFRILHFLSFIFFLVFFFFRKHPLRLAGGRTASHICGPARRDPRRPKETLHVHAQIRALPRPAPVCLLEENHNPASARRLEKPARASFEKQQATRRSGCSVHSGNFGILFSGGCCCARVQLEIRLETRGRAAARAAALPPRLGPAGSTHHVGSRLFWW